MAAVSLAVVLNGEIFTLRAYGQAGKAPGGDVSLDTLFQAASLSKPVTALGALIAVSQGKLLLDEDVNAKLRSWQLPDSKLTSTEKVTVGRILSHTAGLNVHGFPGYDPTSARPTLPQILNGQKPANTPAIRVEAVPGSGWQYSGGGYVILQQLLEDVTGQPFAEYMKQTVLDPLGMKHSTFAQPLPASLSGQAALGREGRDKLLPGGWHVYPEQAAAGLWTTPSDLARFVIALQHALAGRTDGSVTPEIAHLMVTPVQKNDGMGLFASGPETFFHNGRNAGFDSLLIATRRLGVVVMVNGNAESGSLERIARAAFAEYAPAH